ncbi:glycoside hydrolase family 127 protein [Haloferax sp. DFSO52]|uniref:glycoside hydrolase family 127 protein n=1 Tax=Haloferax sp. DFSO52 TaxID=3388505 RepID=UPI003A88B0CF
MLDQVEIDDKFWNTRVETNRDVTIQYQYEQLEASGCLDNFRLVSEGEGGGFTGPMFMDSDAYKWLESASYVLATESDQSLKTRVDEVVSLVAGAQAEDGYLHTYFMLEAPEMRWTNRNLMHELYCAGHLIEAAVAHHQATDETDLLDVATKFADHIDDRFGPGDDEGVPGHEEIELALVKLYRETGTERYLDLARFFIDARGRDPSPLADELDRIEEIGGANFNHHDIDAAEISRNHFLNEDGEYDGSYAQDHLPLREQETVEGHAVRAMYLFAGAAMLLTESDDEDDELSVALERLWDNMTGRRMYITGGIGSEHEHEGFTDDFDLPNRTAYAETCAAVGSIFWNQAMFELTEDARHPALIERTLYNGFLSGISNDGTHFFYVNPLESDGDHHRKEWFYVACCPPNASRLLASLGQYIYGQSKDTLYINQYIGSSAQVTVGDATVELNQQADFPWEGTARVEFSVDEPTTFELALRIPEWATNATVRIAGEDVAVDSEDGFARIERTWQDGDSVDIRFPMKVEKQVAHPEVRNNAGKVALSRGPLVYCAEDVDNPVSPQELVISETDSLQAIHHPDMLDGVTTIEGEVSATKVADWGTNLYLPVDEVPDQRVYMTAVPYYVWDNRDSGPMSVWLTTDYVR